MSRKFIIAYATVAALAAAALVAAPAFAAGGKRGGGHSMGRSGGHGAAHGARSKGGKSTQHAGKNSGTKHAGNGKSGNNKSGNNKSGNNKSANNKSGKAAGLQSQKGGKSGAGSSKLSGGTGKLGGGSGKLSSGPGKLGGGPGKLGGGTGKNGAGGNGQKTASTGLKAGPGAGKVYKDNMGTTPANNNDPPAKSGNAPKGEPWNTPFGKGAKWLGKKLVNKGIKKLIPVYGPIKTIIDTEQRLAPLIDESLAKSALSQQMHDENVKADIEAGKALQEQGGGFLGGGLNSVDMDP